MAKTKTYLIEVALLSKAPMPAGSSLSYFSAAKIAPGTFVRVPLRKSAALAIVLSAREARQERLALRRADFALRKIGQSDIFAAALPAPMIAAARDVARFYAASLGSVLAALVPKAAVADPERFFPLESRVKRPAAAPPERIVLQMEGVERFAQYRTLVRQAFARGHSAMLLVPTRADAAKVAAALSTGIAEFVHVLSPDSARQEFARQWQKACEGKHPVLVIATPACLLLPRRDIRTLILERENSRAYRTLARPFIDMRQAAEAVARAGGRQLVVGDSVLSVEALWQGKEREAAGHIGDDSLIRWRLPGPPSRLVDARAKQGEGGGFSVFSPELKAFVASALAENESVFLFGLRKGLAPTTVCGDCGAVLACGNCGAPVVLHTKGKESAYHCHACGATRESLTLCPHCRSWRLVPLGIGTEEIARQAREHFPHAKVRLLDKDHAPTEAKAAAIIRDFAEKGGILVGTELAFFHLEAVPYAAIVSLDALFSLPDFQASERIFYLVSRLREITHRGLLVQTKNVGKQILAWATQGNILDFYQNEVKEREELRYPPFSIFVKIEGPRDLSAEFAAWRPDTVRQSLIIRLAHTAWPDPELGHKLLLLGPEFSIKVDPESIL